ncbi:DUF4352 domain-containing protein [Streptomyces sp. SKN60]|uniref:DUF4190 domain-containing protein n=1 Tax=Streptomyces sp. SKN60 TaxID=2855506 RepID=UPI002247AAA8|nr:DUF4190 domain-containing protein [Streptomyces sp. SKN60]MCX2185119.1 DUF4352 domain-containing protein [Streptomyces sp. SKN60]
MSYDTQLPHPQTPAPAVMRNGLGTAALILGIIGTLSGFIPLFFWLAGILGVIALILGLVGTGRVKRGEANNKGVAVTGTILGLASLVLSVVGAVITFTAVSDAVDEIDKTLKDSATSAPATPGGSAKGKGESKKDKPLAADETAAYEDGLEVTVSAPKAFTPDEFAVGHTEGNKAYKVTVTIENKGKKAFDTSGTLPNARAGKDGADAEMILGEKLDVAFEGSVLPGKKVTKTFAFDAPAAAKVLTVEIQPAMGLEHDAAQWDLKIG